jgi:hypothetical protein
MGALIGRPAEASEAQVVQSPVQTSQSFSLENNGRNELRYE